MNETVNEQIQNIQNSALMKFLEILDKDLPEDIRLAAMRALVHIPHITARQLIFAAFRADPEKEELISLLEQIPTEESAQLLARQVRMRKAANRDLIVEGLGRFSHPFLFGLLTELLEDPDRQVRHQAAHGLFLRGGKQAAAALCKFISDPDEWISMTILKLLSFMKEHETIPHLQEQYFKETDIRRKAIMVSFLSLFRSVTLINIFDDGLHNKDVRLRANSIEAIAQLELPQREMEARIIPFIRDPNNRIRANAVLALGKGQPILAHDQITDMAHSSDVQLRRSAAYILGNIQVDGYEGLARRLLEDPADAVRRRMVLSLYSFPADFIREQLEVMIRDINPWVRKYAIDLAARQRDFPIGLVIRQFKQETGAPNVLSCLKFFAAQHAAEALRLLPGTLRDRRTDVVCAALRTVVEIGGLESLQSIYSVINTRDPAILEAFNTAKLSLGGVDVIPLLLERATNLRNPTQMRQTLPALAGCLEVLKQEDQCPPALLEKLSRSDTSPDPVPAATTVPAEPVSGQSREAVEEPFDSPPGTEPYTFAFLNKPPKRFLHAVKAFNQRQYGKARILLEKALVTNPELLQIHLYLGLIFFEEHDFSKAREHLLMYLDKNPLETKVALPLVKIFRIRQEWDKIETMLGRFMTILPTLPEKLQLRIQRDFAIALYFRRNYQGARPILEKLRQSGWKNPEVLFYLAMCYAQEKQPHLAAGLLDNVLQLVPTTHRLYKMANSSRERLGKAG
jgi:HEAT repeat protein